MGMNELGDMDGGHDMRPLKMMHRLVVKNQFQLSCNAVNRCITR